ncbi:hypothetical protein CON58_18420 [Bacillus pseudomycoides]|nr:hypothetical protein CON58_18420 [Bacillus pseudomycoides]
MQFTFLIFYIHYLREMITMKARYKYLLEKYHDASDKFQTTGDTTELKLTLNDLKRFEEAYIKEHSPSGLLALMEEVTEEGTYIH